MNTRNNWKSLLGYANEDLAKHGLSIDVNDKEEKGFFGCFIKRGNKTLETYAENFYEDELDGLVTEAWNYALNKYKN